MPTIVKQSCATDPSVGTKSGDTAYVATDGGYLRFQVATNFTAGQYYFSQSLAQNFEMTCDLWAGGGSGADACWFYWGATTTPTQEDSAQAQYAVVLNEFADQVQIRFNGTNVTTSAFASLDNSTWRQLHVICQGNHIRVRVNGLQIFDYADTTRALGGTQYGWGGRSGGTNNEHRIRNIQVHSPVDGLTKNVLRPAPFMPGNAR